MVRGEIGGERPGGNRRKRLPNWTTTEGACSSPPSKTGTGGTPTARIAASAPGGSSWLPCGNKWWGTSSWWWSPSSLKPLVRAGRWTRCLCGAVPCWG